MVNVNGSELVFDHSVTFEQQKMVFAVARENGSGKTRIFKINDKTGNVYAFNGSGNQWDEIAETDSYDIISRLICAWANREIPAYTV